MGWYAPVAMSPSLHSGNTKFPEFAVGVEFLGVHTFGRYDRVMTRPVDAPHPEDEDNVIALPILGDWVSTVSTIDPVTGKRSDLLETVRPAPPK